MKSFVFVMALFGVWMAVDGRNVITPDSSMWSSNVSMTELQSECLMKISTEEDILVDILNIKYTFLSIFIKMTKEIRTQGSIDSLDTMINNICYPALDGEKLYSLLMRIGQVCLNESDTFTNEEKQLIKHKMERAFCGLYMKLTAIITFSPDCMSNPSTLNEVTKCAQGNVYAGGSLRQSFFSNSENCNKHSKVLDCVNQAIRGQCTGEVSGKIQSTLYESRSILGCEPEPNSVDVVNSL